MVRTCQIATSRLWATAARARLPPRRTADRGKGVAELGATRVLIDGEDLDGPYDLILEGVGGPSLSKAAGAVAPGGTAVSYASSVTQPAQLPPRWFGLAARATVSGLLVFDGLAHSRSGAADLATLAAFVARGRLDPPVSREASWRDAEPLPRALRPSLRVTTLRYSRHTRRGHALRLVRRARRGRG